MKKSISTLLFTAALCTSVALIFITFINTLPFDISSIAIDWKGIRRGLSGGSIQYGTGLRNPPWSLIVLLPLGLLSYRSGWGILILATIASEVVSVPREMRRGLRISIAVLVVITYQSLRNMMDGNLEILPIVGLLSVFSALRKENPWILALGFLLASAKPQTTWILLPVIAIYLIRIWPRGKILRTLAVILPIVTVTMVLYGKDWLESMLLIEHRGSIMDVSLFAALSRLEFSSIVIWLIWGAILCITLLIIYHAHEFIDRRMAGFLISAGLLLAPYAAGNSLVTLFAIGVVPLFVTDKIPATTLSIVFNIPYLFIRDNSLRFWYGAYYATFVLFLSWIIFAWKFIDLARTAKEKQRKRSPEDHA